MRTAVFDQLLGLRVSPRRRRSGIDSHGETIHPNSSKIKCSAYILSTKYVEKEGSSTKVELTQLS